MIEATPGATFEAFLPNVATGLVGTLTFRLIDPSDASVEIAETTTGITEVAAGTYYKTGTAPTIADTYLIVWDTGTAEVTETLRVTYSATTTEVPAGYTPTIAEVGLLLRARTVDENGNYLGTFTAATTPTGDQVEDLIAEAVRDVRRDVGPELDTTDDTDLLASAKGLAKYRAAMLVELNYPEQAAADDSSYEKWKTLYDEGLKRLTDSLTTDPGDRQGIASVGVASPTSTEFDALGAAGRAWWIPDYDHPPY